MPSYWLLRLFQVEILSHYGTEFFCPLSQLKVYGVSEFEVIDSLVDGDEASDDLPEVPIEQREMPTDLKKEDHKRKQSLSVANMCNKYFLFKIISYNTIFLNRDKWNANRFEKGRPQA